MAFFCVYFVELNCYEGVSQNTKELPSFLRAGKRRDHTMTGERREASNGGVSRLFSL